MKKLLANAAQIVTVDTNGKNFKSGKEHSELNVLENHSIIIENGLIKDIIPNSSINTIDFDQIIDVKNKVILPGLVDCHTHTAFAGSRAGEFKMKIAGVGYEEIAKQGGGITKTVNSVRQISEEDLLDLVNKRVDYFISQGVTSLEIKSGYGLNLGNEVKLLESIKKANEIFDIDIYPTFLGAHTFPKEFKNNKESYIALILNSMLPKVANEKLAVFCDVFCEETAFSAEQTDLIFAAAKAIGFKIKIHSEQFNRIGGVDLALKYNAISIDHLEVVSEEDVIRLANAKIPCVLLPGVSFFLHYGYAPARKIIDNGGIVALSTDYNPGSSHIANLNLIMSLAAIEMKMTIEETISAVTINAAKALDIQNEVGSIEIGKKADLAIFDAEEYADIVYQVAKNLNIMTIKNGKIIYQNQN